MAIEKYENLREKTLLLAAKSFLKKGFVHTTLRGLASELGVTTGAIVNLFETKEDLLCELVKYVLKVQFDTTTRFLEGVTTDKILFYAVETTLQLYMAETNEMIRELYTTAYSMPKSSAIIQEILTTKLEDIFKSNLPNLKTKDFYMLEIASGGIMRNFMTIPCNMWFTMNQKIDAFLETTFLVYKVPSEKIEEAIKFVKQFDFIEFAKHTVRTMFLLLDIQQNKISK